MSNEPSTPTGSASERLFEIPQEAREQTTSKRQRYWRLLDRTVIATLRVAWDDWRMRIGSLVLIAYILMGTVGVMVVPQPSLNEAPAYTTWFSNDYLIPIVNIPDITIPFTGFTFTGLYFWEFPLGTDRLGQGIAKQIVHATPAMFKMALAGIVFAVGVATVIGTVAGYKGGAVDRVLMTVTDIVLTIPALPLVILIAAIFQPRDPFVVGVILAIDNWPGLARAIRSQVLAIREESYIEAARAMGISTGTVVSRDIVPQLMPYILINAAGAARGVIFESVALYFLGFLPFSTFNWGVVMNLAYQAGAMANISRYGHWLFSPMIILALFSFGLILFSQGMDRVFNPQLRARHAKTVENDEDAAEDVSITR